VLEHADVLLLAGEKLARLVLFAADLLLDVLDA
jgi:hypothetical protein